ncbi:MFS transporter [Compostimonas suwonensis]|uniref:MFS transporter n=1 Tax=Compostimonas suwonensis TaxID=1048394 RepID=A0A2M9BWG8_9MICO|nr:MFS transporter [Compostimonas suwonensis]PJJ62303.1 MFS transporter [Compostimonas suwonensis]
MTTRTTGAATPGIFSRRYLWTTIGANALIFLGAFEAMAVTTIMPAISRDLEGESLYSVAFSGMLAASVIGMVVSGRWADRVGPIRPLITAVVVFVVGLLLAGIALDMYTFIGGRILQGLGSGAINVALYVMVARIYPAAMHPKIFGAFAAAWVLPSLVGPPVAGVVAEGVGWHWVFYGVAALLVVSALAMIPALRQLHAMGQEAGGVLSSRWTLLWAVVVSAAIVAISLGGETGGPFAWVLAAGAFVIVVVALRTLVPRGTLTARRGLPATVLLRGLVAAAFFSTEVYLPYLLQDRYDLPPWLAGLILTIGALAWAGASAVQGRLSESIPHAAVMRVGTLLLMAGLIVQLVNAWLLLPVPVAAAGWLVAAAGMGLVFPRISTLVLGYSTERDQGFNSAAVSITDAAGGATAIAFAGLLFTAFGAAGGGFGVALALSAGIAVAAVPVAFRVQELRPAA